MFSLRVDEDGPGTGSGESRAKGNAGSLAPQSDCWGGGQEGLEPSTGPGGSGIPVLRCTEPARGAHTLARTCSRAVPVCRSCCECCSRPCFLELQICWVLPCDLCLLVESLPRIRSCLRNFIELSAVSHCVFLEVIFSELFSRHFPPFGVWCQGVL